MGAIAQIRAASIIVHHGCLKGQSDFVVTDNQVEIISRIKSNKIIYFRLYNYSNFT